MTSEQLLEALDAELSWRRKEISFVMGSATGRPTHERDSLYRAAWLLIYAHWEGYIKFACETYLRFVALRGLKYGDIQVGFRAIQETGFIKTISNAAETRKRFSENVELIYKFEDKRFKFKNIKVSTKSNLNFDVLGDLEEIVGGLRFCENVNQPLLDENLLRIRNTIAHGNYEKIDLAALTDMRDATFSWIDAIVTEITNSAALGRYKRA
jgi:MAE_28990/MAE_18760-like HEPN